MSLVRGFTLVESLVALLVLSIGLLGMAGLFTEAARSTRTALLRTRAVDHVADMADRIRANVAARGAYDMGHYAGAPSLHDCAPTADSPGSNCGLDELAEDDLARWQRTVQATFPAPADATPAAQVTFFPADDAGQPDRYRIEVHWSEPGRRNSGGNGEPLAGSYGVDLMLLPSALPVPPAS